MSQLIGEYIFFKYFKFHAIIIYTISRIKYKFILLTKVLNKIVVLANKTERLEFLLLSYFTCYFITVLFSHIRSHLC